MPANSIVVSPELHTAALAKLCRSSFEDFVKRFWQYVPGCAAGLTWSWHLNLFCEELQTVAERVFRDEPRPYDVVLNVSPGTSKSTIWSVLYPAWIWTRMPHAGIITASHASDLVLDLASKTRDVINSPLYKQIFPELEIREDVNAKGHYRNNFGGERIGCTVAGKSPIGLHASFLIMDDLVDPKKVLSEAELKTARHFVEQVIPSRVRDKLVTPLLLVMQRLSLFDPTDVMLEISEREGAIPVRHICLPAEITEDAVVKPPELAKYYVDGLMDPVRLSRQALKNFRARGELYYSTQFQQRPYAASGGMFREEYFNRRVKAAPRNCTRVRYWDRGGSEDSGACQTAGTLLAKDKEGNFYIEHCIVGRWEPYERNQKIRACAMRDRARYGPKFEPVIYIEREGGASGRDSWRDIVRVLAGFTVREHNVARLGAKVTRAEPWSAQLAGGNVYVVDNGESEGFGKSTWDVNTYIAQHCSFPTGPLKDIVDSSSGAFNVLAATTPSGAIRTIQLGSRKRRTILRMIVCSEKDLEQFLTDTVDEPIILMKFEDPDLPPKEIPTEEVELKDAVPNVREMWNTTKKIWSPEIPKSEIIYPPITIGSSTYPYDPKLLPISTQSREKLKDSFLIKFAPIHPNDYQQKWEDPVGPWDKRPEDLVMKQEHGKKLWAFLLRRRDPPIQVVILVDEKEERALSVAVGIRDCFANHGATIYRVSEPDSDDKNLKTPNDHISNIVKRSRILVI